MENNVDKIVENLKKLAAEPVISSEVQRKSLVWLPVEKLLPHPDNPRKELGDLSELSESIAENGVMQNLTVIANIDDSTEHERMLDGTTECSEEYRDHAILHAFKKDYTIIIGHRRHAAAVQAGVLELPCVIVDLDYPAQIATMLMENLQRSDLTVYEQAQSFKQLTIDCGMSASSIAKKTGFSETTVRRRLKMAELDQDILKQVSSRQINISDFEQLETINDPKLKNNALKEIGTKNFASALLNARDQEKKLAHKLEIKQICDKAGFKEIDENKGNKMSEYERLMSCSYNAPSQEKIEEFIATGKNIFYYVDRWGYLYIVAKRDNALIEKSKEDEKNDKLQRERACKLLKEAFERAFELRFNFIKNYLERDAKEHIIEIAQLGFDCAYVNDNMLFYKLCGYTDEYLAECGVWPTFDECIENGLTTFRALLYQMYATTEDDANLKCYETYSWSSMCGKYIGNKRLANLYAAFERLGYEMSDFEKELMDGTSELYYGNENKNDINAVD